MGIVDVLGNHWECECLGCALANGSVAPPGGILLEGEYFILHQDPEIPIEGFLILASKAHVRSVAALHLAASVEMAKMLFRARTALDSLPEVDHCTLIQEERSAHFHLWILPHYAWMDDILEESLTTIRPLMRYARAHRRSEEIAQGILGALRIIRSQLQKNE